MILIYGIEFLSISAFISSADFDLDDGDKFMFVSRMVPDVSFEGSTISGMGARGLYYGMSACASAVGILRGLQHLQRPILNLSQ